MTTTVNLRKLLHRKSAEYCTPLPVATAAGSFIVCDKEDVVDGHKQTFFVAGASAIYNYSADEDGWMQMPNSGIAGTFGAGSCGEYRAISAMGGLQVQTATGGTTTTLNTAQTIVRDLSSSQVRVVAGTGIGYIGTITKNTVGATAVLTVSPANGVAFDATTQFQVFAGALWFLNAGAGAIGFAVYDWATNVWTQRSVTNLPTSWASDGMLVSTGSQLGNEGAGFVNGTATAGSSTTLTDSGKTWPVNGFANFQLRIISGTGAGQVRIVASNTATVLTVPAWTTTPDATSVYRLEGNDDVMYLTGNGALILYKFTVSTNTWSTITPGTARAAVIGAGGSASWIDNVLDSKWTDGTYTALNQAGTVLRQNGRYIYSFRATAGSLLDIYDIAANIWINGHPFGGQGETFTAGSCYVDTAGVIYCQKDATGRVMRFDVAGNYMEPLCQNPVPQGAAVVGSKMFLQTYKDGTTRIRWLYTAGNTRSELLRYLLV